MKVLFSNRMKSNIVGMEANMEHLLEKACAFFYFNYNFGWNCYNIEVKNDK